MPVNRRRLAQTVHDRDAHRLSAYEVEHGRGCEPAVPRGLGPCFVQRIAEERRRGGAARVLAHEQPDAARTLGR